ncbi:hypothetical protein ACO0TC_19230 [Pseudomonas aeruginosa]|uniref:hypothetical protein n=1 Tax=Pseudomonas TaxID=286 RepID=UPI001FFDBA2B|nr:hypothetical protein [Pseudomonas sp. PNPG3]MCK2119849.1 hypothetical protein [Pseudomonas sp. PNPG3]
MLFEIGRLMLEHGVRYDAPIMADAEIEEDENDRFPICYRVFFDGADTGYSLSSSGAIRALLRSGLTSGSARSACGHCRGCGVRSPQSHWLACACRV